MSWNYRVINSPQFLFFPPLLRNESREISERIQKKLMPNSNKEGTNPMKAGDRAPKWVTPAIMSSKQGVLMGGRFLVEDLVVRLPQVRWKDAIRAVMLGMLRATCEMAREIDLDESDLIEAVRIDFKHS